jgi:phospholipid transport system substrate-binding protein
MTLTRRSIFKCLILSVCLGLWSSAAMSAENPQVVIKSGTEEVLRILQENCGDEQAIREKVRTVVDRYFDFNEISKRALGRRWKDLPPEKQQEFTRDFSQLLFNTYIGLVEKYTSETIAVSPQSQVRENHALVKTVVTGQAQRIIIDYYMSEADGKWRVYDIVAEGIGLVNNYRSQFDAILSKGSFDDLLAQLKRKASLG